eukprot:1709049-Amphidinium_carterae.1
MALVETRLPYEMNHTTDDHLVLGFKSHKGHDGQMLLVCRSLHPKVISSEALSPRIARVKLVVDQVKLMIVIAHAPVALASREDHQLFLETLREACTDAKELDEQLVLLADLNSRFGN